MNLKGGKVTVGGDLKEGATINLEGGNLTVKGEAIHTRGTMNIGGGLLDIGGDYSISNKYDSSGALVYGSSDGYLRMSNENDVVKIGGDFYVRACNAYSISLEAGVVEVGGNITNYYCDKWHPFYASGTNKIIARGNKNITIDFGTDGTSQINELEIENAKDRIVTMIGGVSVNKFTNEGKINVKSKDWNNQGDLDLNGNDLDIEGNLKTGGAFNIKGKIVNITGNFEPNAGTVNLTVGKVTVGGDLKEGATINLDGGILAVKGEVIQTGGTMNIDGGLLDIGGDYSISNKYDSSGAVIHGTVYAILKMTDENDVVKVKGDFYTSSNNGHDGKLTAGIMQVGGDFTATGGASNNFYASESHKVILNGPKLQNVKFESTNSKFNILEITKDYETGYKFTPENCWNSLNITIPTSEVEKVDQFKVLRSGATSLVLSWEKTSGADGYELYRATSENGKYVKVKTISDGNILTNSSTGLQSSTSYYYKIRAYKTIDGKKIYGDYSLLKATTNPAKPTGIKVINSTQNALRIGWNKVDKANGYEVFRSTSENGKYARVKTITDNNTVQSASPNLESGKTYYYRVKAYLEIDGKKLYSESATLKATTKSFGTITGLKMAANTENSIRINWNQLSNVDGYEVFRAISENGKYTKIKTITDNTITSSASTNLQSGTTYYYKVRSYKIIDGIKQYSEFSLIETSTKPDAVNGLKTISITDKSIKIGWDKINSADGYEIFRATSENGSYVKVGTTSNLNYTSTKVVSGQTYYYKVKAYKLIGTKKTYGSYSDVLKIIVK